LSLKSFICGFQSIARKSTAGPAVRGPVSLFSSPFYAEQVLGCQQSSSKAWPPSWLRMARGEQRQQRCTASEVPQSPPATSEPPRTSTQGLTFYSLDVALGSPSWKEMDPAAPPARLSSPNALHWEWRAHPRPHLRRHWHTDQNAFDVFISADQSTDLSLIS